jgi:hypothetical protein
MKLLKNLLPVCLLMTIIFSSCGGGHKDQILDLLAVKTKKDATKISLLDFDGKIVAEDEFDASSTVIATNGVIYENNKDGKVKYYTLSDKKVKPLFDKTFDEGTPYNEDYAVVRDEQGILSLIDKKGNAAIANLSKLGEIEVLTAGIVSDGLLRFKADDGKWGYANTKGEVVIKPAYNKCENFVNGIARVLTDKDEFQIIDKKGNKQFKGEEDVKYGPIFEKNMIYGKKNGEGKTYVGLVDLKGEKVVKDGKYTNAGRLTAGLLAVRNDDSWGVINTKGEVIGDLRFKFDAEPLISQTGNVLVTVDKKVKLYNKKGELVTNLDDYSAAFPITKDKFIGIRDDKFELIDDKGKTVTKDSYFWVGFRNDDDALTAPDVYLNELTVNSKYINFDKIFSSTIVSITTKDIAGLNESSNIESVMQKFPYAKLEASNSASAGNDYSQTMGTKSAKSKDETSTETAPAETATATEDKYPGVNYSSYQTYKGASQFEFNFTFNGTVKTYDFDATTSTFVEKLDPNPLLNQVDIGFGSKSGDIFKKKMKEKLLAAGWKTTNTDTDSSLTFTNGANSNSITLTSSSLSISFYNPFAAVAEPAYGDSGY